MFYQRKKKKIEEEELKEENPPNNVVKKSREFLFNETVEEKISQEKISRKQIFNEKIHFLEKKIGEENHLNIIENEKNLISKPIIFEESKKILKI